MSIERTAVISLGANIGDAAATLTAAAKRIGFLAGVSVDTMSSIYVSKPAYKLDQEQFCNAVMLIKTTLAPYELLAAMQALENDFGRVRLEANGPRTLDIDIVDYEGVVSNDPALTLPHPLASERDFVVTPLLEIAPGYTLADERAVSIETVKVGKVIANESAKKSASDGKLLVCATPIGNLGDITKRVVEALRDSDLVLAEDTRVARKLLSHLDIHAKIERCDENVIRKNAPQIIEQILSGAQVALVSDAGMPGIADPGSFLVAKARQSGCKVEVLPGASAVLTAVVASGFGASGTADLSGSPGAAFYFGGFLPRKKPQLAATLERLSTLDAILVFFESPHRTISTLKTIAEVFPRREVALARELTKLHEEVLRDTAGNLVQLLESRAEKGQQLKGEVVIVVAPPVKSKERRVHKDRYARR